MKSKNNLRFLVPLFLTIVPSLVLADSFWQIIPSRCTTGICTDLCSLAETGQNLLNMLIALSIPIAVAVIMYNAFKMIVAAGNPEMLGQAIKGIIRAVTGILVVFGAWILINSLFVAFARQGVFPWPWYQINCR